jgi:hypothetical protein
MEETTIAVDAQGIFASMSIASRFPQDTASSHHAFQLALRDARESESEVGPPAGDDPGDSETPDDPAPPPPYKDSGGPLGRMMAPPPPTRGGLREGGGWRTPPPGAVSSGRRLEAFVSSSRSKSEALAPAATRLVVADQTLEAPARTKKCAPSEGVGYGGAYCLDGATENPGGGRFVSGGSVHSTVARENPRAR